MNIFWLTAVMAGLLAPVGDASAQSYSIDWSTIDGGGGSSTGGMYTATGTIAQPDAGTLSGEVFALAGGFWPGLIEPPAAEAPTLAIRESGDSVIISWSPAATGFALESTIDLSGGVWTAEPAGNPVRLPIAGLAKFYRLVRR